MPITPWQRPDALALAIRACARRIAALNQLRTQTKNQLHAAEQTATTPDFLIAELHQSIAQLDAHLEALRQRVLDLIAADEQLQHTFELLISVTGIAAASAIQLLGERLVLPDDRRAQQWVATAGLDPRQHQSGPSVNKKPRLSKAGNRYLRTALYMPALSAARHDPNVRADYRHLIERRGLKKIQAVCAVMRKLLHAIQAMLKNRTPCDSRRFYSPTEAAA
ncbi:transposase [Candidatus Thiosymbion oneisti]|uniref:transposase n=4 Tax=Candidatus Thiosymbion oneisti TaxID=589554 RepID=UPI001414FEBD|nr:transposase [Candidatus Thiosymbion oneisti]